MNSQKIKELIEKYDNQYNGVVYANDVLEDLESLLEPEHCEWETMRDGFDTKCGYNAIQGSKYGKYCQYCGGKIKVIK